MDMGGQREDVASTHRWYYWFDCMPFLGNTGFQSGRFLFQIRRPWKAQPWSHCSSLQSRHDSHTVWSFLLHKGKHRLSVFVQSVQGATPLGKDRKSTLSSMQFRGHWREFPAKRKILPQKVVSGFSGRFCSLNCRWKADGWSGWFTLTPPETTDQS